MCRRGFRGYDCIPRERPYLRAIHFEYLLKPLWHMSGCCMLAVFLSVRWSRHTLWQVLDGAQALATCQCVWMRRIDIIYCAIFLLNNIFSSTSSNSIIFFLLKSKLNSPYKSFLFAGISISSSLKVTIY